jgi:hypothetical protein
MRHNLIIMLVIVCSVNNIVADDYFVCRQSEEISNFSGQSNIVFYNAPEIASQTARFDLERPCDLNSVKIRFYAPEVGRAFLRLFGYEAGANYPLIKRDLIEPIEIIIDEKGYVTKKINLIDYRIDLNSKQFFVMIDSLSEGISLVSDSYAKESRCTVDSTRMYTSQIIEYKDGRMRLGKYGYDISCEVEYHEEEIEYLFEDITAEYFEEDFIVEPHHTIGLASSDLNRDGFVDLMIGGEILINRGGREFDLVNDDYGIEGNPLLSCFIDINSDGETDILFYGFTDKRENNAILYLQKDKLFEKIELYLPEIINPKSFSLGDINGDNLTDLFISQAGDNRNILLVNDGANSFKDISNHLGTDMQSSRGCAFVDFDGDDDLDLFVVNENHKNELWLNNGKEVFVNVIDEKFRNYMFKDSIIDNSAVLAYGNGCNWVDYDNDGDFDLILPVDNFIRSDFDYQITSSSIITNSGTPGNELTQDLSDKVIQFSEEFSGARWFDIDNNGLMDFVLTSSFECKPVEVYLQVRKGEFKWATYKSGLPAGIESEDILPIDIDNDGKLDLVAVYYGQLRIFKNIDQNENKSLTLDFSKEKKVQIGKKVSAHAGDDIIISYLKSGDGIMIQEPLKMIIGTKQDKIDSLIVHDPGSGLDEKFYNIPTGSDYDLDELRDKYSIPENILLVKTYPSPFENEVTFSLQSGSQVNVSILIYSIDGKKLNEINTKVSSGSKEVQWDGRDHEGKQLSQGAYFYEIKYGQTTLTGKLIKL